MFRSTPGDMPATSDPLRLSPWRCFFNTCTSMFSRLVASLDSCMRFRMESSAELMSRCEGVAVSPAREVIVATVPVEATEAIDTLRGVLDADSRGPEVFLGVLRPAPELGILGVVRLDKEGTWGGSSSCC